MGLMDVTLVRGRIPLGAKISAFHQPAPGIPGYARVFVARQCAMRGQLNFKFEFGFVGGAHVPGVALMNLSDEIGAAAAQTDGKIADFHHDTASLGCRRYAWQIVLLGRKVRRHAASQR